MKFSYTYRDNNGSRKSGVVEAPDRAGAFAALAKEHIRPLSLREGGGDDSSSGKPLSNLVLWGAIAVALLVVGGILYYSLSGKDAKETQSPTSTHTAKASTVKERPAPKQGGAPTSLAKPAPQTVRKPTKPGVEEPPAKEPKAKPLTPEDEGYVSPDPTFAERYKRFKEEQAKLPFKHMSELEIHRIISTMPGETILPTALPPNFEEDFIAHLNDPIVINDDDSDEVKQDKQTMIAVKARLKELMDKGESVRKIMEEEQEHLVKVMTLRDNLFAELRKIEESATSSQEIDDYVKAANKMLEEYGAKYIKLPMSPARFRLLKLEGKVKQ